MAQRVLVVLEAGRNGLAALARAREIAEREDAELTVLGAVPQAPSGPRCGNSATEYNSIVRDTVAGELEQARARLGEMAGRTTLKLLVDGTDPPLEAWSAAAGFDLILLPARRRPLRAPGHPAAAALRRAGAEVLIVDPRARRA